MPAERRLSGSAEQPGDLAVLMGAKTGRDGIGGASVLASAGFEDGDHAKRPNVQVGDPFQEKLLIEACLELVEQGLLRELQGLERGRDQLRGRRVAAGRDGHGGRPGHRAPTRAVDGGLGGADVWSPGRVWLGEPGAAPRRARGLPPLGDLAGVLGEMTTGGSLRVRFRGEVVAEVSAASLADDGPVYSRPRPRPPDPGAEVPLDADPAEPSFALAADQSACASKRWVWEQYDRFVGHGTVAGPGSDAAVLRVPGAAGAVALATDGNGRYAASTRPPGPRWPSPRRPATWPAPAPSRSRSPTASTSPAPSGPR